jgi:ABC-2 type transport system ATP-binding protein
MRQRLHVARGLLHDPEVVFLDEPSIGIDPVGARELRGIVANLVAVGKTVLLTTHYMFEADELCDRIAVIRSGEIVAEGTPGQLKDAVSSGSILEVETYGIAVDVVDSIRRVGGVRSVALEDRGQKQVLLLQCDADSEVTQSVLGLLGDVRVGRVSVREPTLEDAYVALVTGS